MPVLVSRDEVDRLIAAARKPRSKAILMLLYGAGLRVSEVLRLRAEDVDSGRGLIHIHKSKCRRSRCVMLSNRLLKTLRTWWKGTLPARVPLSDSSDRESLSRQISRRTAQAL